MADLAQQRLQALQATIIEPEDLQRLYAITDRHRSHCRMIHEQLDHLEKSIKAK